MKSPILIYSDPNKPYTLFMDASQYAWSGLLTQEHTPIIDGKTSKHQHSIIFVPGLSQGGQLKWATLTKEAYAIYMEVKKLSFSLADATITS